MLSMALASARSHARHRGRIRARDQAQRIGLDIRLARLGAGLTQMQVAHRAGLSQPATSRIERGVLPMDVEAICRAAAAVGCEIGLRVYPAEGVGLRDSGQMHVAEQINLSLHDAWSSRLEVPVGADRRAADLVLSSTEEVIHAEIERWLVDFQAQLRAGHLKREALTATMRRPVRFVLALPDTTRNRAVVRLHAGLVATALPVPSHRIWRALRTGTPIGGDGILWVRVGQQRPAGRAGIRAVTTFLPDRRRARGLSRLVNELGQKDGQRDRSAHW
jgi:transcriptional regulator with XRE-family HTH domain